MLKVYLIDINKVEPIKEKLPLVVIKHVNQYKNKQAKSTSKLAWQCLNHLLRKNYKTDLKTLSFNKKGKPFLKNKKIYFSLSHSFDMIAIAISNSWVGIDVEKIINKKYANLLAEKMLNSGQKQKYITSKNKLEYLTKVWTQRETIVKLNGCDINIVRDIKCIYTFNTLKITDAKKQKYYVSCINKKHEKISEVIKWVKK